MTTLTATPLVSDELSLETACDALAAATEAPIPEQARREIAGIIPGHIFHITNKGYFVNTVHHITPENMEKALRKGFEFDNFIYLDIVFFDKEKYEGL